MSLPPVTIHIKRKATDEPIDFLRVEQNNGKRQRCATNFVFSRQHDPKIGGDSPTTQAIPPQRLDGRPIKPISRAPSSQNLKSHTNPAIKLEHVSGETTDQNRAGPSRRDRLQVPKSDSQLRRFHISRRKAGLSPEKHVDNHGKKRNAQTPTVFIERRIRTKLVEDTEELSSSSSSDGGSQESGIPDHKTSIQVAQETRQRKRPGQTARINVSTPKLESKPTTEVPQTQKTTSLPSGLLMPWDVSYEKLAAEMQAFTLQEIGLSIANSDSSHTDISTAKQEMTREISRRPSHPSRFKPKKPALRYHERHPEEFVDDANAMDLSEPASDEEMTNSDSDSEYIIDTYVRIPMEDLTSTSNTKDMGLLILESQPDIDEFYNLDPESDEEEDDLEEDENAEDHYTADYPEDEVDSDDEFGRNPYSFQHEDEEYDAGAFSDGSEDERHYPSWMK